MSAKKHVLESHALLNVSQVATLLGISQRTVWRLKDAGQLPAPVRLGSSVRWNKQTLIKFLDAECDMNKFMAMQEVTR